MIKHNSSKTKALFQALVACIAVFLPEKGFSWISDNGDGSYSNPPLYADYPDPDIIRVGDDFYFSTTTFVNVPGLTILHSKDLVNWEIVSHVVDRLEGDSAYDMEGDVAYRYGLFASSLRYHEGFFYVAVTPVNQNTRIYRSESAEGPWTLTELNTSAFDPGLFFDDDGTGYLVTSGGWDGTVSLLTLSQNYSRVVNSKEIFYNQGAEGSKLLKRGEWYYMFHSIPSKLALTVSRAKNLYGPWETKPQINDGTGGHQGAIVDLPDGSDYGFVMLDAGPIGRVTNLSPIFWKEGWPVWGTPEVPGQVPVIADKPISGYPVGHPATSDSFDRPELGMQWQWNHNPANEKWSLDERPGYLRLHTTQSEDFWHARNTLTQKSYGPWCRGELKLSLSGLTPGDVAGFGLIGKISGYITILCDQENNRTLGLVVRNDGRGEQARVTDVPLDSDELYLRVEINFLNETAICSYSADGLSWSDLGGAFEVQYDWRTGTFQGPQFATFCYNPEPSEGYLDIDSFGFADFGSTYEEWISGYLSEDHQRSLWDDPDQDHVNNATEFVYESHPNQENDVNAFGKLVSDSGAYIIVYPSSSGEFDLHEEIKGNLPALNLLIEEVTGSEKTTLETGMPELRIDGWQYRAIRCRGNIDSILLLAKTLLEQYRSPVDFAWFEYSGTDPDVTSPLEPGTYRNPVFTGFYPDPSIHQIGGDYYLINSTFVYYPGLPIFHSKDLVNWEQIGSIVDRPDQFSFDGLGVSRGMFAPSLTYYDGTFYAVGTMVDGRGNFVVTATDPAGPWSDPVYTPFEGIDPSLFFDDDGRAWMVNNGAPEGPPLYEGHRAIWLQEFDPEKMQMTGPRKVLVNGGVDISTKPIWIEGPHLYKINGWYYLSCAEGGTGPDHSQVILRSKSIDGPYKPWSGNPILTQRYLDPSVKGAVTCTGHADYVIGPDGQWWAVFLGVRPYDRAFSPMGRETFVLPMKWTDDGWPMILPSTERVPLVVDSPAGIEYVQNPDAPMSGNFDWRDDFDKPELSRLWIMLRTPRKQWWQINPSEKCLSLIPREEKLYGRSNPSYLARRVQHSVFEASLGIIPPDEPGVSTGLAVFQNETHHYYIAVRRIEGGKLQLFLERALKGRVEVLESRELPVVENLTVRIVSRKEHCAFDYSLTQGEWIPFSENLDATMLTSTVAGGFVGATVGPHARAD